MTRASGLVCLAAIGATTALLWLSPAEAADRSLPGATVESVVAIAENLNPTVAAASLDPSAALNMVGAAGVLADPLVFEVWDVNSLGVGQCRFGVEQEIKLGGKYGLERNIARSDADAAKLQSRATVTELIAKTVAAHGEYNAVYEAVGISIEVKRQYNELLGSARSRYGTTSINQQDVIRAEMEAATAEGDVVRRQGEQKSAAASLYALIGRLSSTPLAPSIGFRAVKPLSLAQALARSANPMLALAGTQPNSAAQTKSLTDLNYYPDLTLGATYVQRPGTEDTGEFMPLRYEVKDAEQRAAGARLGAAQTRAEALRLRIDGQIADAWFGADALRKVVQIYISRQPPPAHASVDDARNGFQAGSTDLFFVLEAERRLRAVQLDLLELKVELQTKYAEMECLAGGSL
jgi:outer membrane protein TolC